MINLYPKEIEGVWFGVACDDNKVYATNFGSNEGDVLRGLLATIPFNFPFQRLHQPSAFAESVIALLKDIYDGKDVSNSFTLVMEHLSDYTRKVIKVTSSIPVGFATFYGAIAEAAGGSPRAVGRVMATHPFPPIVPCHRVVSSDFSLGGYGGGLDVKREFLNRERRGHSVGREVSVDGRRLRIFPVEFVLRKSKC